MSNKLDKKYQKNILTKKLNPYDSKTPRLAWNTLSYLSKALFQPLSNPPALTVVEVTLASFWQNIAWAQTPRCILDFICKDYQLVACAVSQENSVRGRSTLKLKKKTIYSAHYPENPSSPSSPLPSQPLQASHCDGVKHCCRTAGGLYTEMCQTSNLSTPYSAFLPKALWVRLQCSAN